MDLFDTHAHLCDAQFAQDRADVLWRAAQSGVTRVVEIADAPSEWEAALALSRARPEQVRCSLGLHPYYADEFTNHLLTRLEKLRALPEVVAVGEIGLDYVKTKIPKEVQLAAFEAVLRRCREWDKPVVVHCRGAYEDLRRVVGEVFAAPRDKGFWGVIHCFSGGSQDAVFFRERGFALGVDGPVTYPKNDALRGALKIAGLESLVLETDSPYLPPQSSRGKRNEPRAIPEIAAKLAEVFEIAPEEIARATTRNAETLFRISRLPRSP